MALLFLYSWVCSAILCGLLFSGEFRARSCAALLLLSNAIMAALYWRAYLYSGADPHVYHIAPLLPALYLAGSSLAALLRRKASA